MRSEKPISMGSIPSLRRFPNVAFETVPMFVWLAVALCRPFKEDRPAPSLPTPPGDRKRDVLGFVTQVVSDSSSSTFQIFRNNFWWLFFPTIYLLGYFSSLRHVQDSNASPRVFEGGYRTLTHAGLGFAFPLLWLAGCQMKLIDWRVWLVFIYFRQTRRASWVVVCFSAMSLLCLPVWR